MKNENTKYFVNEEKIPNNVIGDDEEQDILDILFDEDNDDPIVLQSGSGEKISFEQIAVIPMKEAAYCILKPIEHVDGVGENEALLFRIDEDNESGPQLLLVTEEKVIDEVFAVYDELVDDANDSDGDESDSDETE